MNKSVDEIAIEQFNNMNPTFDLCTTCVFKGDEEFDDICPECREKTLHFAYYGSSCHCVKCGYGWAAQRQVPPCYLDRNIYTVIVDKAEKKQYIKLAKAFMINVVEAKAILDQGGALSKTGTLFETEELLIALGEIGVEFAVDPDPLRQYHDLLCCDYRA